MTILPILVDNISENNGIATILSKFPCRFIKKKLSVWFNFPFVVGCQSAKSKLVSILCALAYPRKSAAEHTESTRARGLSNPNPNMSCHACGQYAIPWEGGFYGTAEAIARMIDGLFSPHGGWRRHMIPPTKGKPRFIIQKKMNSSCIEKIV